MKLNYCMQCGKKLGKREIGDEGIVDYCDVCKKAYFHNPTPCVLNLIVNEKGQLCLLKQSYISCEKWTLCAGYAKIGETLEQSARREILEETGQEVESIQYVSSYFFEPKSIIMTGFIAKVKEKPFNNSIEVSEIMWCDMDKVDDYIIRDNNLSGIHFDKAKELGLI